MCGQSLPVQQALELSLRDLQQQQQPGGGQSAGDEGGAAAVMDGSAPAEHRRYNPLYSTSGPANPLFGQSAGSEAPSTRCGSKGRFLPFCAF